MLKLLYLLVGITLKQTIDEIKALANQYAAMIEQRSKNIQEYKPIPALEYGSVEAHRAIAEHQHRLAVKPEVSKLARKIRLVRWVPVIIYGLLTIGLSITIAILEASGTADG